MIKKNQDIAKNYSLFKELISERKFTTKEEVYLNRKKPSRSDTNYDESKVILEKKSEEITLIVEAKVRNHSDFKFQLRCKGLTEEPFFRYDSDGSTHFNRHLDVPLELQKVTTPHFNSFDKDGISIAYKTEVLKNPKEVEALKDINLGFTHFCFESNLRYPEDDFSKIIPFSKDELGLAASVNDPLSNIDFI